MNLNLSFIPSVDSDRENKRSGKIALYIIILLAVMLRFIYLIEVQSNPINFYTSQVDVFDQYNFVSSAKDLLANNWLGSKITKYSPAYSYIIAFLFKCFRENINCVFIFQIFLGILAVYIFYRAVSLLFENKTIGLIAAFIAATYSPFIFYECSILRAPLIAYINLFGFYFLLKAIRKNKIKHFLLAGIFIGLSTILRTNALVFIIIPTILIATKANLKFKAYYALLFVLGVSIIISPIAIRNKTLGSNNLISGYGPSVFWIGNSYDSKGIGLLRTPLQKELSDEAQGSILKTVKILAREIIKYPREYRSLYGRKFRMLSSGYEIPANLSYDLAKENSKILKISFLNFTIISPLAILGLFLMLGKYRHGSLLYVFLFVLSASLLLFHIQSRYRIPFIPFFIIFASYSIYWFIHMVKIKDFKALGYAIPILVCISLFTKPDYKIIRKYFGSPVRSIDYSNLTNAYLDQYTNNKEKLTEQQRKELLIKAIGNRKKSIMFCSPYKRPYFILNLGMLYLELKQYHDALDAFYKVLTLQPEHKIAKEYIRAVEKHLERQRPSLSQP